MVKVMKSSLWNVKVKQIMKNQFTEVAKVQIMMICIIYSQLSVPGFGIDKCQILAENDALVRNKIGLMEEQWTKLTPICQTGLVGEEDDDFLRRSLDLVRRNGISLRMHPHATALFPIFSLFNHACVPSAKFQVIHAAS